METRPLPQDENNTSTPSTEEQEDDSGTEKEFRLTVRKLELPVRPRGVLAE